ncbi:MAG: site-2 protease family protein [Gemmatimonadetes bacterium]|nr:site-2 protease family protein [Gemmatimonadota bacterium]
MPLLGGFGIGRWFGFPIRIDFSWFVLIALIVWVFSTVEFPRQLPGYGDTAYLAMGVAAALFFFLSLLLHELAHSVVARSRGIPVQGITLFIFGGVAQTTKEAERPVDEFLITVVGPMASFALAGLFWSIGALSSELGVGAPAAEVSRYLGWLNFVLAVFNLVPGFPLDGGRLFRAAIWQLTGDLKRATRWATAGGRAFGYALMAGGLFLLLNGALINGVWLAFIGWFLANAAASSYRQFLLMRAISGVPVSLVLRRAPAVPAEMSAVELAGLFVGGASSSLPVVQEGRMTGIVDLDKLAKLPLDRRTSTTVGELMSDLAGTPTVPPHETLDRVVTQLQKTDEEHVLVVDGDHFLGVVTLDDIGDWVQRARKLGLDRSDVGLRELLAGGGPVADGPNEDGPHG